MGAKWGEASPAEKLLTMYTMLLISPRALSLGQLAERMECSKQTVSRLVSQLEGSQFGKVLREQRGREAFFSLDKPRRPPGVSISAEGLSQLALCRDFLLRLLPPGMAGELERNLERAEALVDTGEPVYGIGESLSKGRIDYGPFEAILRKLVSAIAQKRACVATYRARRDKPAKTWSFAPMRLLAYHECLYVAGWRITDKNRVEKVYDNPMRLALQRFQNLEVTRRSTAGLPALDCNSSPGLGIMEGEPFEVAAWFSPAAATYATERQWSEGQKVEELADGSVILRVTALNAKECAAWILGFGASAKVISPEWLKMEIAAEIAAMAEQYAK